ncbi:MAG TPA: hypothetical protein VGX48_03645 [Pyrinomonadaceae bacterium]|nr:hypothetical protein [Pyrinomonadaceae bacterium]
MRVETRRVLSALVLSFAVLSPAWAQEAAFNSHPKGAALGGGTAPAAAGGGAAALEERRAQLKRLKKRRDALERYALSVRNSSVDYRATEKALLALSSEIEELNKEIAGAALVAANPGLAAGRAVAPQTQGGFDFSTYARTRINRILAANTTQKTKSGDNAPPSISEGSTSFVERGDTPDLGALATTLISNVTRKAGEKPEPVSIKTNLYSLAAAVKGFDPLDPYYYEKYGVWRRFEVGVGTENGEEGEDGEETEGATLASAKVVVINNRQANKHPQQMDNIFNALVAAAGEFSRITDDVLDEIFKNPQVREKFVIKGYEANLPTAIAAITRSIESIKGRLGKPEERRTDARYLPCYEKELDALNRIRSNGLKDDDRAALFTSDPRLGLCEPKALSFAEQNFRSNFQRSADMQAAIELLGGDKFMDSLIEKRIAPFMKLVNTSSEAFDQIRKSLLFSLSAESKKRREGNDEYEGKAILEYGLSDNVNLTLNGGFNYVDSRNIGADKRGGSFSGQFNMPLKVFSESNLVDPETKVDFSLGGEGKWMTGSKSEWKTQAKLKFTLMDGFEVPFSFTYANRTELVDESEVRGQIGFSIDFAKALRLFKFKNTPAATPAAPAAAPATTTP